MLRTVTVACQNVACTCRDQARQVHLRLIAMGVVELPRLLCAGCSHEMLRIVGWNPEEGTECPGNSSSTSDGRQPSAAETSKPDDRRRAPATGRRSNPAAADSSTAGSAAGSGRATAGDRR